MKSIVVTGGAGFIGSHTVIELSEAGYRPVVIDNFSNSERFIIERLEKILGRPLVVYDNDYQDVNAMHKILKAEQPVGVIHFAAYKAVGESQQEPLKYYKNNISGLITLLEILDKAGVANLVFSSSATVYGDPDELPLTEVAPLKSASSPYGSTKQMGETIVRDVTQTSEVIKSLALRYFNPIGAHKSGLIGELPRGVPSNLIPFLTQTAAGKHKELVVFGDDYETPDGSCIRDYIHVVDLARAHVQAVRHLEKQGAGYFDAINIGTGHGNSVLEVIKTFEKVTGVKVPYRIGPRRSGDVVNCYAAVDKAQKILAWQTEKNLEESLADAWRWQQTL